MEPPKRPLVGIGVLIFKGDKVLVGKRKGSHGAGTWALPGGHLELGESFEACAAREVLEETGITLHDPVFAYAVNSVMSGSCHYVTVFMRAQVGEEVEAVLMEADKCEGWEWVQWPHLPKPLFQPLQALLGSPYRPLG